VSSDDITDVTVAEGLSALALHKRKLLNDDAVITYSLYIINPIISEDNIKTNLQIIFENGTVVTEIILLAQSYGLSQLLGISFDSVIISDSSSISSSSSTSETLTIPIIGGISAGGILIVSLTAYFLFRVTMRKVNPDTEDDEEDDDDYDDDEEEEEEEVGVPNNNYDDLVAQKMRSSSKLSSIVPI